VRDELEVLAERLFKAAGVLQFTVHGGGKKWCVSIPGRMTSADTLETALWDLVLDVENKK
jgi:hypothetical protein